MTHINHINHNQLIIIQIIKTIQIIFDKTESDSLNNFIENKKTLLLSNFVQGGYKLFVRLILLCKVPPAAPL